MALHTVLKDDILFIRLKSSD